MIASAPGKLILSGEYAVLDGAPALVIAVNRRVIASLKAGPRGSSTFLLAVANELERRLGKDHIATRTAAEIGVDSKSFYDGTTKLGLGSSAAVTVAATALALGADNKAMPVIDRQLVMAIASAAHAGAQDSRRDSSHNIAAALGARGVRDSSTDIASDVSAGRRSRRDSAIEAGSSSARGSGADIAASVYGGVIAFQRATPDRIAWPSDAAAAGNAIEVESAGTAATADRLSWPTGITLIPFFTGVAADTPTFVRDVHAARDRAPSTVNAALAAIDKASRAACQACAARSPEIAGKALLSALALAGHAMDQLAAATGLPLVPSVVTAARDAMTRLGGTAKTTGAGGGDIAVAVIPATEDATAARRYLIEIGCQPLNLTVDTAGVDLQPDAQ